MPPRLGQEEVLLTPRPLNADERHKAAITVCALAARGFNLADPRHLRAAARLALPVLAALGLADTG